MIADFHDAHRNLERSEYAKAAQSQLPKPLRSIAFGLLDGKDARAGLMGHLKWASQTQSRIDAVRDLYGFTWNPKGLPGADLE